MDLPGVLRCSENVANRDGALLNMGEQLRHNTSRVPFRNPEPVETETRLWIGIAGGPPQSTMPIKPFFTEDCVRKCVC